jgi:hypothetical protein
MTPFPAPMGFSPLVTLPAFVFPAFVLTVWSAAISIAIALVIVSTGGRSAHCQRSENCDPKYDFAHDVHLH